MENLYYFIIILFSLTYPTWFLNFVIYNNAPKRKYTYINSFIFFSYCLLAIGLDVDWDDIIGIYALCIYIIHFVCLTVVAFAVFIISKLVSNTKVLNGVFSILVNGNFIILIGLFFPVTFEVFNGFADVFDDFILLFVLIASSINIYIFLKFYKSFQNISIDECKSRVLSLGLFGFYNSLIIAAIMLAYKVVYIN
jgi:hypothetical protein